MLLCQSSSTHPQKILPYIFLYGRQIFNNLRIFCRLNPFKAKNILLLTYFGLILYSFFPSISHWLFHLAFFLIWVHFFRFFKRVFHIYQLTATSAPAVISRAGERSVSTFSSATAAAAFSTELSLMSLPVSSCSDWSLTRPFCKNYF